ncbi:HAD family phosphatase [Frankia sp. QA3]|uniref:HAD family hydrolase n=1 Tax=Frankia sp. QA3 TaxID=710111 RepID=UPI0002F03502|nr:HAD-IA family hydrolase [Frankia sp. QA3]
MSLAVASSSYYQIIDAVLGRFDLLSRFDLVYSAEDEKLGKPYPAIYLSAARKLGVDPSEGVAIEDSRHGVRSAKSAGYRCVAVPQERYVDRAGYHEAEVVLRSLAEVDGILWRRLLVADGDALPLAGSASQLDGRSRSAVRG